MVKASTLQLRGTQHFRQRLVLSTLSGTAVRIEDIRADDTSPGLRNYEVSFLRLMEKVSDGCVVEINETGTKLRFKPGLLVGGKQLNHDCGLSRSIGYFLEPLIVLGLFGKKPLSITLKGYGISLVAETTSGCLISAECAANYTANEEEGDVSDAKNQKAPILPEDIGSQGAMMLLEEIKQGGVVDSTHQGLLFLLCALCPEDVSKVRVGKLSTYGIKTLRHIKDFLGVQFNIKPDPTTGTVILTCVGCGYKNFARKVS